MVRELNIYMLIRDIFAGRPLANAMFVGYNEVTHHSGILFPGAFGELIGFHGSMDGAQIQPFHLHPVELKVDGNLIGAAIVIGFVKTG